MTANAPGSCSDSAASRSARRAAITTFAPTAWSTRAKRSPSPEDAPVTMAVTPSRRNSDSGSRPDVSESGAVVTVMVSIL